MPCPVWGWGWAFRPRPKRSDGAYDAYIEMPLPLSVEAVLLDVGGMPSRFFRVELPGIVHFVHFAWAEMNIKTCFDGLQTMRRRTTGSVILASVL